MKYTIIFIILSLACTPCFSKERISESDSTLIIETINSLFLAHETKDKELFRGISTDSIYCTFCVSGVLPTEPVGTHFEEFFNRYFVGFDFDKQVRIWNDSKDGKHTEKILFLFERARQVKFVGANMKC